jgi:hypothetical protein
VAGLFGRSVKNVCKCRRVRRMCRAHGSTPNGAK